MGQTAHMCSLGHRSRLRHNQVRAQKSVATLKCPPARYRYTGAFFGLDTVSQTSFPPSVHLDLMPSIVVCVHVTSKCPGHIQRIVQSLTCLWLIEDIRCGCLVGLKAGSLAEVLNTASTTGVDLVSQQSVGITLHRCPGHKSGVGLASSKQIDCFHMSSEVRIESAAIGIAQSDASVRSTVGCVFYKRG